MGLSSSGRGIIYTFNTGVEIARLLRLAMTPEIPAFVTWVLVGAATTSEMLAFATRVLVGVDGGLFSRALVMAANLAREAADVL